MNYLLVEWLNVASHSLKALSIRLETLLDSTSNQLKYVPDTLIDRPRTGLANCFYLCTSKNKTLLWSKRAVGGIELPGTYVCLLLVAR